MKISIAMATYNGAKYIEDQLQSFIEQTRKPDGLIVLGDGSTDNTVELVEQFGYKPSMSVKQGVENFAVWCKRYNNV
jgi:glycosyltransferase involved in cell wall biosynthesis